MKKNTRRQSGVLAKNSVLACAGMLLCAIIWGTGFAVVKKSLDIIPPLYMMAFRFTIAAAILAVIFRRNIAGADRSELRHSLILGVFLFAAYAFQTIGCQYTTAGKNAFLTAVYVILVPLIAWALGRRRPRARVFAAAALAIVGIGLLSLRDDLSMNKGDALTLVCGFWYALHLFFIARWTQTGDSPLTLATLQIAVAALLSWLFAPLYDGSFPAAAASLNAILAMGYLGVFSTALTFVLQNVAQKYVASSTAAVFLSTEAVFGALFSALFLGEVMSARMLIGGALLFAALVMA
ncbi:MAG: DMT family transporter [Spirochaetaceae bacterium]|jgi:drug/metabolite transporter (DMT)-like permease|nr:DMT family transporter [Spirochaetaceae bacterium]